MKFFKHTQLLLLLLFAVTVASLEVIGASGEGGDAPPPPRHHRAKKATPSDEDDEEASDVPRAGHAAPVGTFQWVPNFNFVFGEHVAEDERIKYRRHHGGAAAAATPHPAGDHVRELRPYNSDQLSQWHQAQVDKLTQTYRAVSSRFGRNVAGLMLSLIYRQGGHLLIRNIEIPNFFLSGFSVDDAPIKNRTIKRQALCIQNLYPAEDSALDNYMADLHALGVRAVDAAVPSSNATRKAFYAEQCHSERGIAIFLRKHLLSAESAALFAGIDPKNSVALVINIASYRDMCGSCQQTITTELRHRQLFIEALQHVLGERCIIVVAQSGIKAYEGAEPSESTRGSGAHHIAFNPSRPIDLARYNRCVLHMENKGTVPAKPTPKAAKGDDDEEEDDAEE
jgi:hypothetical protein